MVSTTGQANLLATYLIRDFATGTQCAQAAVSALYDSLNRNLKNGQGQRLRKLLECWYRVYGGDERVFREKFLKHRKTEVARIAARLGIESDAVNPCYLFFTLHTYIALIVKLVAYYFLGHTSPNFGAVLAFMRRCSDEQLEKIMRELQSDVLLAECGIRHFHDGDIFQWYLDSWNENISRAVRVMLERLQNYNFSALDDDRNNYADCFKYLYQRLVPARIRHQLGEYYTPDWLVELLLNELGYQGQPDKRLLDPACGSGSFLVLAIGRLKQRCLAEGMSLQEMLRRVIAGIVGWEINPLAVLAARANYLRALGNLVTESCQPIRVPVHLADSILIPAPVHSDSDQQFYELNTWLGRFRVPRWFQSCEQIVSLCRLLEASAGHRDGRDAFLERATTVLSLPREVTQKQRRRDPILDGLSDLYMKLVTLRADGLDRVGLAVLRNALLATVVGKFDFIVGNPPWIGWESLSPEFRKQTKSLWQRYGLFAHGGMETILGKGKKDVSMLMSYVVTDRLLRSKGKLGFVITQSAFKTAGAADGFRRFQLGGSCQDAVKVKVVHDLSDLQIFEGASTRTCVFVWEKGKVTHYPVPYRVWQKIPRSPPIHQDMRLAEVTGTVRQLDFVAEPVNPQVPASPWLTIHPALLPIARRLVGRSHYKAYEGVNSGGANGVFWVEIVRQCSDGLLVVRNIIDGSRRAVPRVCVAIEPDLVYPLLRGCEVKRWCSQPSAHVILAQDVAARKGIATNVLQERFPKTFRYLKRFEPQLRARAAFRRYYIRNVAGHLVETAPFYSMFNVGAYTFSPWKVVWHRMVAPVGAVVLGQQEGKPILPQETHAFVPTHSRQEAFYLAGMLNSQPFRWAAMAYSPAGSKSYGSPHLLENLYIPRYDSNNPHHAEVAAIAETIQEQFCAGQQAELIEWERQLDEAAGRVWGLDAQCLASIQAAISQMMKADLTKK